MKVHPTILNDASNGPKRHPAQSVTSYISLATAISQVQHRVGPRDYDFFDPKLGIEDFLKSGDVWNRQEHLGTGAFTTSERLPPLGLLRRETRVVAPP